MTQRMALVIAAAVTAFMLVLVGGVVVNIAGRWSTATKAQAAPAKAPSAPGVSAPNSMTAPTAKLSADQAAQIALNGAARARVIRTPELVNFQNTVAYEVVMDRGVVYLDANSGKILYSGTASAGNQNGERRREAEDHEEREHDDDD